LDLLIKFLNDKLGSQDLGSDIFTINEFTGMMKWMINLKLLNVAKESNIY
jgi:hypothetical protein